jgi:hypothetical protein
VLVGLAALLVAIAGGGAYFLLVPRGNNDAPATDDEEEPTSPIVRKSQPRPLIVLSPEEEKKVNEVTRRGIEFLKKSQRPDGSWAGTGNPQHVAGGSALAGLTLLECDAKAADPVIQKAALFLRGRCPRMNQTYELSLAILFFGRLGDAQDRERIQQLALRLAAGQKPQGGWEYDCPILASQEETQLLKVLKDLRTAGRDLLFKSQPKLLQSLPPNLKNLAVLGDAANRPKAFFREGMADNSNTQFALLGLWAARRQGLPLEPSLALVARRFEASQNPDGSFHYRGNSSVSPLPTMTCAGLLGLAVGYGVARDTKGQWGGKRTGRPLQDPAVTRAVKVLSQRVGEARKDPKSPPPAMTELYFLWSVERVAVLWRLKTIGLKDWYRWGLDMLFSHQRPDGSWHAGKGVGTTSDIDTCFALLFLQRVNLAEDLTEKLEELAEMPTPEGMVRKE